MAHSIIRRSLVAGVIVTAACTQAMKVTKDDSPTVLAHQLITAPNPGEKGSFAVKTMYYGSGTDKRRAEYESIEKAQADASPFVYMFQGIRKVAVRNNVKGVVLGFTYSDDRYGAVSKE